MLSPDVLLFARNQLFPNGFARQTVELDEPGHARGALAVHFASGVEVRHAVRDLAHDRSVDVVVHVIMPDGSQRVEVDAEQVTVIVAEIAVIAIDDQRVFRAGHASHAFVMERTVPFDTVFRDFVFVNRPVLAGVEQESARTNR